MKFVAVTACPTGIAHTYMAAEQLAKAAKEMGHEIKVETQGAMGIENELSSSDISSATAVIFAVDIMVENEERFDDLPKVSVSVQEALKDAKAVISKAESAA